MAKKMMKKVSWRSFQKAGMFWFVNRILHVFGYVLVFEEDGGKIINVYPARTKFRGFDNKVEENGFKKVSRYMVKNSGKLLKEALD